MTNRVSVDFVANTGTFETDVKRAARIAKEQTQSISASTIAIGSALGHFLTGAIEGVGHFLEGIVTSDVELAHLAEKTGLSAQAMGGLRLAATQSGVDMDRLGKTVAKVAGIHLEAAAGSKVAAAEMRFFGITAKDTTDQAVDKLLKKFEAMPPSFDRAGLAAKIFGQRIGADFLVIADNARGGLNNLEEAAAKLGVGLDEKTLAAAEQFEKSMALVKLQLQSVGEQVLQGVLPTINAFVKELSDPSIAADFKDIASIAIESFALIITWAGKATEAIAGVARDSAAARYGAASDDAGRLQEESTRIGKRLSYIKDVGNGPGGPSGAIGKLWALGTTDSYAVEQAGSMSVPLDQERAILEKRLAQIKHFQSSIVSDAQAAAAAKAAIDKATADSTKATADAAATANEQAKKDFRDLLDALNKTSNAHHRHAKAVKEDTSAQQDLWKQLQKDAKAGAAASDDVASTLDEQTAAMRRQAELIGGPLLVATNRYHDTLIQLRADEDALRQAAMLDANETAKLAKARKQAADELANITKAQQEAIAKQGDWRVGAKRAFESFRDQAHDVAGQTEQLFSNAFQGAQDALLGFLNTGKLNFKSFAISIIQDIERIVLKLLVLRAAEAAINFLQGGANGSYAANGVPSPNALGNAFSGGNVIPFARGGVVSSPTVFPMANGAGLMGEAGPEAIMPLTRGADGKLGVRAAGGSGVGSVNITVVVDNNGNASSKTSGDQQQGRQLGEAIKAAVVKELVNQQRQGGMLWGQQSAA